MHQETIGLLGITGEHQRRIAGTDPNRGWHSFFLTPQVGLDLDESLDDHDPCSNFLEYERIVSAKR